MINIPRSGSGYDDALAYVKTVEVAFQDKRQKYDEFLKLIRDSSAGRIYITNVETRVKALLKGHTDLILGFNIFLPTTFQFTLSLGELGFKDALAFRRAVKVAMKGNYNQFLKVLKDFKDQRIDTRGAATRVKELLKGHTNLVLGFNTFLPKEHQLETTGKKVKKAVENCELPCDVFDIMYEILDFDDFFQFSGVCKNWRTFHQIYWRSFLASQEPLLLQVSNDCKRSFFFINIPEQKNYCLKMMEYFFSYHYVTSSGGYFIMVGYNRHSFMLINPFTRIKKVINTPTFESNSPIIDRALLAFGKCSEEFVLVVLSKYHLHVYQSRNGGWVTYSTMENSGRIVDFVVLHNIIYVVTNKANIGVLNLNSTYIKFLKLKSTPDLIFISCIRLINCDEQLLVVDIMLHKIRNVYKIDFSTMNYVKLKTLGNIALFYAQDHLPRNCYALSNPNRWGYESNSVYVNRCFSTICRVYSGDEKNLQKCITLPASHGTSFHKFDWCFRHLQYEVDYSLVE